MKTDSVEVDLYCMPCTMLDAWEGPGQHFTNGQVFSAASDQGLVIAMAM